MTTTKKWSAKRTAAPEDEAALRAAAEGRIPDPMELEALSPATLEGRRVHLDLERIPQPPGDLFVLRVGDDFEFKGAGGHGASMGSRRGRGRQNMLRSAFETAN